MNHADQIRLRQLLDQLDPLIPLNTTRTRAAHQLIDEARAIVDAPAYGPSDTEIIARHNCPPNPALDAFLTEPIHEYRDPNAGPTGWAFLQRRIGRHRHRVLNPLKLALVLAIASAALIALTATSRTWGSTETHSNPENPSETPSRAAQGQPHRSANLYTYPPRQP